MDEVPNNMQTKSKAQTNKFESSCGVNATKVGERDRHPIVGQIGIPITIDEFPICRQYAGCHIGQSDECIQHIKSFHYKPGRFTSSDINRRQYSFYTSIVTLLILLVFTVHDELLQFVSIKTQMLTYFHICDTHVIIILLFQILILITTATLQIRARSKSALSLIQLARRLTTAIML